MPLTELERLVEVMARLRQECPWDAQQTHRSLVQYLVEEAAETIEAIELDDQDHLREELERQQNLFGAQPNIVQRFLEAQARQLSDGLLERTSSLHFTLPDRVVGIAPHLDQSAPMEIPAASRRA